MGKQDLEMPLPENPGYHWCRAVDTACDSPQDILEPSMQVEQSDLFYVARSRSVVVFESRRKAPAQAASQRVASTSWR
jgi:hypothetical protein